MINYAIFTIYFIIIIKKKIYVLNCKLNLCELCEKHNHYIEKFKEIYPLKEEIDKFNNKVYNLNDFDYKKIKKVIEIKILLVKSLNENMTNYN